MMHNDSKPIGVHPENQHYLIYHGDPVVLITSAEHYGAVVNAAFDYNRYLRALRDFGLNYTRIYPGALFEPEDKFISGNTLGVKPENLVLPWARSSVPGYAQGVNLYDLDRWDDAFFIRLGDYIQKAGEYGIIVEICFFNSHSEDTWSISPLCSTNNIQDIGNCCYFDAQTLRYPDLVFRQDAYVRKIVQEVNCFDNVILEICDEPTMNSSPDYEAKKWVEHLAAVIADTERQLPKKHLVAQQIEGTIDLSDYAEIQVIVSQYVWENLCEQMGGMQALDCKYHLNKPIELNETDYYPVWYPEDPVAASRVEAWEFIVGGGASFNQLNGVFTVDNPEGISHDNLKVLGALNCLKNFIYSLDFIRMRQDKAFIKAGVPSGAFCRGISEIGMQYALYLHHSGYKEGKSSYITVPGTYIDRLVLDIPYGEYKADWVEPATGTVLLTENFSHVGGDRIFRTPAYQIDIALRVKVLT